MRGNGSSTLLLVDDEYAIVEAVSELLAWEGYQVLTAGDGLQALQAMRVQLPDLVLTDVMMPRMDGPHLIRAIWDDAMLREVPILLATAVPSAVPAEIAERVPVLRKPYDLERLLAAVERGLGRRSADR
ncbi:MAG: response regulator [Polyangiaceae bacterium]